MAEVEGRVRGVEAEALFDRSAPKGRFSSCRWQPGTFAEAKIYGQFNQSMGPLRVARVHVFGMMYNERSYGRKRANQSWS